MTTQGRYKHKPCSGVLDLCMCPHKLHTFIYTHKSFHCWYNQSLRNKWTHKEHRYKTEAIIFWSYSLSITTQVLWQDKPAWARLSAQSRRYEAVLEMQPRQNSTVWMAWYTKMSPILVWRRNRWNELSSLDAQNSSCKDIWAFLYVCILCSI